MSAGRGLGYGLLGGGGVLAVLMAAWLAVSGAEAGGVVLGLMLLAVLAGPLIGGGLFVLSRQQGEARAEAEIASKRRVLEADRLFRRELAAELRQLARRPSLPAERLAELAEDLERRTYDSPEWYGAVVLDDADLQALGRYDDLVWERTRALGRGRAEEGAVEALEEALDQRRALLVRGRRAPEISASRLLRSGAAERGEQALLGLGRGDAVSYDGQDYVVEAVASYFAEGRTWTLAHLEPSGRGEARWLYVAPGAVTIALLSEGQSAFEATQRGTATVDVDAARGSARGVLVGYEVAVSEAGVALRERWPDGAEHAYVGVAVRASDVEVWPAAAGA